MGYDPVIGGKRYQFGVSGKLYKLNVLLYDRQTDSLWSQIRQEAVTGPLTGTHLPAIPLTDTTWRDWKERHPDTLVESIETGYVRDYDRDPYGIRQERGIGVRVGDEAKIYPFGQLRRVKSFPIEDQVGGQRIRVFFDGRSSRAWVENDRGERLTSTVGYVSAWRDFFPRSKIFKKK